MRFLIFPLLLACTPVANAFPANIWWPEWTISSSEELSLGIKYEQKEEAPRYPLAQLFDGDLKTAWVYNATSNQFDSRFWQSRYGLRFVPDNVVALDSIRLANGQNFSPARFKANHRAKDIKITLSNGKERRVYVRPLADKTGWQTLAFPRFQAKAITLEFPHITRSQSQNADFCLSEIELHNRGRKIAWNMPKLVMYSSGMEGDAGAYLLIRHDGVAVNGVPMDTGDTAEWSPSGRYVAGANNTENLWIYDAAKGTKISKTSPPQMSQSDLKWFRRLLKDYIHN